MSQGLTCDTEVKRALTLRGPNGADVVNQAPDVGVANSFGVAFHVGRRTVVDDAEDLAVGAAEIPGGVGEIGGLSSRTGAAAIAFAERSVTPGAEPCEELASRGNRFGRAGHRVLDFGSLGVPAAPRRRRGLRRHAERYRQQPYATDHEKLHGLLR